MTASGVHVVTGAFGYSGRYIAQRLLDQGCTVRTLSSNPRPAGPLAGAVPAMPLDFARPERLAESLAGVSVLYNTYWVRFNHRHFTFAEAVRNSRTLFDAARQAGVERIVHTQHHQPLARLAAGVFSRQGPGGAGPARLRRLRCDPSPGRVLRRRGHPHQQHGLDAAPPAGLRHVRPGRLSLAADPRRTTSPRWPWPRAGGAKT